MQYNHQIIIFFLAVLSLLGLLLFFIGNGVIFYQKRQRRFRDTMEETKVRYDRELIQSQLEVQVQTLDQVSRELHDNVALQFTLANLYLHTINLPPEHPGTQTIHDVIDLITKGLDDLRDISKSFSLDLIRSVGIRKAIDDQVSKLHKTGQYEIAYEVAGSCDYDDEQKEIIVFRIFQEAINNIIKHAQASAIQIKLDGTVEKKLTLSVTDNGVGFPVDNRQTDRPGVSPGGLRNMRVRASLLNAEIYITSTQGTGTTIKLCVPLSTDEYIIEKTHD